MRLLSLRGRIFISLIFLVVIASLLIAGVTIFQYSEQSNTYHEQRLERKENQLTKRISYILKGSTVPVTSENVAVVFEGYMDQTADVLNINFKLFSLNGVLIGSTQVMESNALSFLPKELLQQLDSSPKDRFIDVSNIDGIRSRSSYFYIFNANEVPIAIVNVPYFDDDSLSSMELRAFLFRLIPVYVIMLIIAIVLAFIVSSYVTRSLETISHKLNQTKLTKTNTKIELTKASREISALVDAYNGMVEELEQSAVKLAKSQREAAWREMAKQVAHEIKNPLTPMRLTIQHFEQQAAKGILASDDKVHEFCQSLIQQIDTMTAIASAFSQFAAMPTGQSERINVVTTVQRALELYKEEPITFDSSEKSIFANLDANQLLRIVNNLVSNAIQAVEDVSQPKVRVAISIIKDNVVLSVKDNGIGVSEMDRARIFEPTFTTKTSGMGLGLSMVKSIVDSFDGSVHFRSKPGIETCFEVHFPRVD